jgi:hypothetical protein
MPTQVQFRRGTTAQNNSFTGAAGELSINTSNSTIRVHDGSTAGGSELATVTYASNVTNFSTGTLSATRLAVSGVAASTYGNATLIPTFTVDTYGRITSASNVAISATVANTNITGLITSAQIASIANTQITGNITASQIAPTAVTSGSYGGTGNTVAIVIDPQGRITSASNVSTTTGVIAATYGNASFIPSLTVDAQGRITAASNVAVTPGVTTGKSIAMAIVFGG